LLLPLEAFFLGVGEDMAHSSRVDGVPELLPETPDTFLEPEDVLHF